MRKPVIGVMPIYDAKKQNSWMLNEYFDAILAVGGIPVMLPLTTDETVIKDAVELFDGFLFTGGDDVHPNIYGCENLYSEDMYLRKDQMEKKYIECIVAKNKPLFGICRGLQILNASLGGTLYQDLEKEAGLSVEAHRQKIDRYQPYHNIKIKEDSTLFSLLGKTDFQINSLHHQAVKDIAPSLTICALSEDGIIEGAEMKEKRFIIGVQWHPELLFASDESAKRLFQAFINACEEEIA